MKVTIELEEEAVRTLQGNGSYSRHYVIQDIVERIEEAVEGIDIGTEEVEIE
jgi:hypothetical protein